MLSRSSEGADELSRPAAQASLKGEPREQVLEFARAQMAEDPYAFHFEQQDYRLRMEGGAIRNANFPWSQQLLADLQSLAQDPADVEAARRLGAMPVS